jgi:hypothetical protein
MGFNIFTPGVDMLDADALVHPDGGAQRNLQTVYRLGLDYPFVQFPVHGHITDEFVFQVYGYGVFTGGGYDGQHHQADDHDTQSGDAKQTGVRPLGLMLGLVAYAALAGYGGFHSLPVGWGPFLPLLLYVAYTFIKMVFYVFAHSLEKDDKSLCQGRVRRALGTAARPVQIKVIRVEPGRRRVARRTGFAQ